MNSVTRKRKVLFLCTGNSCRSQMAEALLRHLGHERFEAFSAGSHPAGFIHELAVAVMQRLDVPLVDQSSKSWDEFAQTPIDLVITLCDEAAREPCPVWPASPLTVHWSLPDPAYYPGDEEERLEFAMRIAERLRMKIEGLLEIDFASDRETVKNRLEFLGEI